MLPLVESEKCSNENSMGIPRSDRVAVAPEDLEKILGVYQRGLCLQAFELAKALGPLHLWSGTDACSLAGRLAANLGAPRLSRRLHLRAFRQDARNSEARFYRAYLELECRGPLAAWNLLKQFDGLASTSSEGRADLIALQARIAALLRDFDRAETLLAEAEALAPEKPWIRVERASILEQEDCYEKALAAARESLELHPHRWYRPGVQMVAHLLQLLDRDAEALDFLREASKHLENGPVAAQLFGLQFELGRYPEAWENLQSFEELSPLREKGQMVWLASQRSIIAYFLGDLGTAAEQARKAGDEFHNKLAERLAAAGAKLKRVKLPVTFVRQHYKTCAPATMASIGRFWGMPTDHLAVAEAICYDGTPSFSQRDWAEQNGWVVREFRVTWESAAALLDRGIPFTITTVETANAHLQAVIGYDSLRETLLLRDPYQPYVTEAAAKAFLERYQSTGPHGMVLVPRASEKLLEELELPDARQYDHSYEIERALFRHNRDKAEMELERMRNLWPEHALTWQAQRSLAAYDANSTASLLCVNKLLDIFPGDANLRLAKLAWLRDAPYEERLQFLKNVCDDKNPDPIFWAQYAQELKADAREHGAALRLMSRSLRARPMDAASFSILADIWWCQRRFADAAELYRFAACLDDKKEQYARTWFIASRQLKQTDSAIAHLSDRFRRFGARSSQPAMTLFWAYEQLDQISTSFEFLEAALKLRPDDGELLGFAADAYARWGKLDKAETLLASAEGKSHRAAWLRTAANTTAYRGDAPAALALWRQVLDLEPLALDAHHCTAQFLAETEGREAALRHVQEACARFPHYSSLHQLWIDWLRADGAAAMEPVLRRLIEINPAGAWAYRELALALAEQRRFDEALQVTASAVALEPTNPYSFSTQGRVYTEMNQFEDAKRDYRQAIQLSVDNGYAITSLMEICATPAERKETLVFIENELIRQVVFGEGVLAFRNVAHPVLEPEDLLKSLRLALKERPDLWHAWSAMIEQLTDMNLLEEALKLAGEATSRFPLLPRLWLDLGRVHQARLDHDSEIAALTQAWQINPQYSAAGQQLADAYERSGRRDQACTVLEQAIARVPLDATNHGCLANLLWKCGRKPEALDRVKHALQLYVGYDWAWRALREWAQESGDPALPTAIARDLTSRRGGEARSWLMLAQSLPDSTDLTEKLEALDQAIRLNPRGTEAYDLKALLLAQARRYDDAMSVCQSGPWGTRCPTDLQARMAWIERQRGRQDEAIARMSATLQENPGFYWGWKELAEWLWSKGELAEAREAALRMVRLAPMDAVALGYLADIKMRMQDRAGAKADFQHALKLNPEYGFAAFALFDLQLDDREFSEATLTLDHMRKYLNSDWVTACDVRFAARRKDKKQALKNFQTLGRSKTEDSGPIEAAIKDMAQAGWERNADNVLREAIDWPDANPQTAVVWVRRRFARRRWRCPAKLRRLAVHSEVGRRGVIEYIEQVGAAGAASRHGLELAQLRSLLGRALKPNRAWLHADDSAWGKVGYALLTLQQTKAVLQWMSDWKSRSKAEPWMLHNLVLALQQRGRDEEANEVICYALKVPNRDGSQARFKLWAATEELLAGNIPAANELLTSINAADMDDYDQKLHGMTVVLLKCQKSTENAFAFTKEHRDRLKGFLTAARRNRSMLRVFDRSVRLIAQRTTSSWPLIWGFGQRHFPLLIGATLLALVIWLILAGLQ
jgi:tetratricopeptide (TPR) repeat protein